MSKKEYQSNYDLHAILIIYIIIVMIGPHQYCIILHILNSENTPYTNFTSST